MEGKLIVFEGIDGVGKETQLRLANVKLKELGIEFKTVAFPRHGQPAAYFVDQYLKENSPYGGPEEVGPYRASIFYALDRYEGSFKIKKWLKDGLLVLIDRYIGSNIGHQGGKIEDSGERARYVEWLYDLEYVKLGIPKPNVSIVLWLPPEIAQSRIESRGRNKDSHEINLEHLKKAQTAYLWAVKCYPEDFRVVKCFEEDRELSEGEVHQKVWEIIQDEIGLQH